MFCLTRQDVCAVFTYTGDFSCVCLYVFVAVDRQAGRRAAETDKKSLQTDSPIRCQGRVTVRKCSACALSFRPATAAVITALNIQGALHPCCLHFISSLHNQPVIGRANESTLKHNLSIIHSGAMQLFW